MEKIDYEYINTTYEAIVKEYAVDDKPLCIPEQELVPRIKFPPIPKEDQEELDKIEGKVEKLIKYAHIVQKLWNNDTFSK